MISTITMSFESFDGTNSAADFSLSSVIGSVQDAQRAVPGLKRMCVYIQENTKIVDMMHTHTCR